MSAASAYLPVEQRPVISASSLKTIGGSTGCERKCAGAYLWGMKQAPSDATEFGSALHKLGEIYQVTGEVGSPESRAAAVLAAGAHYLSQEATPWGALLIEHEHRGFLPCGTPYVAYLDGQSTREAALTQGGVVLIRDLKSTSDPKWALDSVSLPKDLQSLLYAWVLLCDDGHWYAPRLPDGCVGPQQWRQWSTAGLKAAALEWIYFLTRGVPRAWMVTDPATGALPQLSAGFVRAAYDMHIAPLVEKRNALHAWRAANPSATLNEIDRSPEACVGRGRWCGVAERNACDFSQTGTPILQLINITTKKDLTKMTAPNPQDRLAALRARAQAPKAPEPVVAPPAVEATPEAPKDHVDLGAAVSVESASATTEVVSSTPPPASSQTSDPIAAEEPKRGRGRPKGSTKVPAPTGAGINPPEVAEALAKMTAATPIDGGALDTAAETAPLPADGVPVLELAALLSLVADALPAGASVTVVSSAAVGR